MHVGGGGGCLLGGGEGHMVRNLQQRKQPVTSSAGPSTPPTIAVPAWRRCSNFVLFVLVFPFLNIPYFHLLSAQPIFYDF